MFMLILPKYKTVVHDYVCEPDKSYRSKRGTDRNHKQNTERLRKMNSLLSQKKALDEHLNARQQKMVYSIIIHIL